MTARRLAAVAAGAALVVLAGTAPTHAADGTSIAYVERTDDGLQVLVSVPPDAEVDTENVAVSLDGSSAPASASPADSTTAVRRTAVMVIDTSNSMRGTRIEAARSAAETFLASVPDDVYVGVVTFDGEVTRRQEPTLDRAEAVAAVSDLTLSRATRLYDGVQVGVDMAGDDGQRQLLVLSDGADTSDTALEDVTSSISGADVAVTVVSLEQSKPRALRALEGLAGAGGGEVISSDSGALAQAFDAQADILARQVLVTVEVPSSFTAAEATVSVTLGSDLGDLTAEAFVPISEATGGPDVPAVPEAAAPLTLDAKWLYAGIAALGLGLLALLVTIVPRRSRPLTGAELASAYTERVAGVGGRGDERSSEQALAQATQTVDKVLKANKGLEARISERLEGAGNPFKPAEWIMVHLGVFILSGIIGLLLGGGSLVLGLLFLFAGAVGPWMYLGFKRKRRRKAFERSLPDTLQLISGSLAAGLSLAQSVDTVVKEGQDPISTEFKRVLVETRLGISLDDALEGVADRFESKDFAWVVMAIRIQRQVGGNLAELLDTVAGTMREREYMRRQVAALAAEGKLSAWVLGLLPPLFLLYLLVAKRDYVMPMFTDPMGWVMLAGAAVLLGVGVFWMSRVVKVEV